ncbi:hypothetical protein SAMN04487883_105409 [Bacillus licheniformis]|jgi:hypothetical protein|nr:hypothetical protein SAMN04487883_105409 [Bacillus licheniformis]
MQNDECFIQRKFSLAPAPRPPTQSRLICRSELACNFLNSEGHDGLGRQNWRLNTNIVAPSILHFKSPLNQRLWASKSSRSPCCCAKRKTPSLAPLSRLKSVHKALSVLLRVNKLLGALANSLSKRLLRFSFEAVEKR